MAASSTAVTVLTPNGRRQTVKVSPNTPMLQVLEDVCKKHGFNPDDHGLKFQRNVLDLTLQWRFANLPNNAKLEIVPSTRKQAAADSQVRIALQMEDGSRMQGSFPCSQHLWELLAHFPQTRVSELSECGSTPVCVYMRDEVIGEEALKETTLKSLGLTGGSAIVRFLLKKNKTAGEEDGRAAMEIAAAPTPPAAEEGPPRPASPNKTAGEEDGRAAMEIAAAPTPPAAEEGPPRPASPNKTAGEEDGRAAMEIAAAPTPPAAEEGPPRPASLVDAAPSQAEAATAPVKRSSPDPAAETQPALAPARADTPALGTPEPRDSARLEATPSEDGERAGPSGTSSVSLSSSAAPLPASFVPFSGGGQRLGGQGHGAAGLLPLSLAAVGSPKAKKAKCTHGSSAKGQVASSQEQDSSLGESLELVERQPLIFHMDSESRRHDEHQELPDEFFEVTVDDIRKRFAQLKSERRKLEEIPLMTKALREAQMKEKMDRYPKVVLRIQFPDRHVLQGFFTPLETVGDVRHFVKSHLADSELSFYLFIAPPKTVLDDSSATLFQANLFPGAVLYFGSNVKTDYYLQGELLSSRVSASQANESVASSMPRSPDSSFSSAGPDVPLLPPEPAMETCEEMDDEQDVTTRPEPVKVPKWLKLPGKK